MNCRKLIRYFISSIGILLLSLVTTHAYADTQKVLVLHSYHQGLEWTDSISKGISDVFKPEGANIEVYFEYLDTKRNTGNYYAKKLLELFRAKENKIAFDIIITSDNNALEFVRQYGSELYPNTPIVFCGVNYFTDNLISGLKQVTGIVESADIENTINLMLDIHTDAKKILILTDETPTGIAIRKTVEEIEDHINDRVKLEYYTDFTWDSLEKDIASLSQEYLIYLLALNRDRNNQFISYIDSIAIVNKVTNVPVYGSWDFYLGKGIIGGIITSGYTQGEMAAQMALRILSGESANTIPVVHKVMNNAIFDYNVMRRFNIRPRHLPDDAHLINQPVTLIEQIKNIPVLIMLPVVAVIISLIAILVVLKIRHQLILKTNNELDHKVKEKTKALNTTNEKLNILITELELANSQLNEMAIRDGLTGVYNRRFISERLSEEYHTAQRYNSPLSLLLLDIDHFKQLNDIYGHQYGDYALRRICQAISHVIRENDIFSRYGGEEFLLVLPHTSYTEAMQLAQRIRHNIESLIWDKHELTVTISGGISEYTGQTEEQLLQEADEHLYKAKAQGRNQIC